MKISLCAVGQLHGDHRVALLDAHGDDAAGARVAERRQLGLLDRALARAHHDEVRRRRTRCTASIAAIFSPASICTRLAIDLPLAVGADVRNLVDLQPVGAAAVR